VSGGGNFYCIVSEPRLSCYHLVSDDDRKEDPTMHVPPFADVHWKTMQLMQAGSLHVHISQWGRMWCYGTT
jgi:hypothetical protein